MNKKQIINSLNQVMEGKFMRALGHGLKIGAQVLAQRKAARSSSWKGKHGAMRQAMRIHFPNSKKNSDGTYTRTGPTKQQTAKQNAKIQKWTNELPK